MLAVVCPQGLLVVALSSDYPVELQFESARDTVVSSRTILMWCIHRLTVAERRRCARRCRPANLKTDAIRHHWLLRQVPGLIGRDLEFWFTSLRMEKANPVNPQVVAVYWLKQLRPVVLNSRWKSPSRRASRCSVNSTASRPKKKCVAAKPPVYRWAVIFQPRKTS